MSGKRYPLLQDDNWLKEQYYGFDKSIYDIAEELGCNKTSVSTMLKRKGLPIIRKIYSINVVNEEGKKQCPLCKEWKDIKEYSRHKGTHDGLYYSCKNCSTKRKNIAREIERVITLFIYTNGTMSCELCGYDKNIDALSFDHINGGGTRHREETRYRRTCLWLKDNDYPGGFRVLCRNCNWIEGLKKR